MRRFTVSSLQFTVRLRALAPTAATKNSKLKTQNSAQRGFTVIELLIATTIFSIILLMAVAGILHITRMYYKGVVQSRSQEVTRGIVDEIGETLRFSKDVITIPSPVTCGPDIDDNDPLPAACSDTGYICIGAKRYTYAIDRQLKTSPAANAREKRHVLWADQPVGGCTAPADFTLDEPTADGRELLSEHMRLTRFDLLPVAVGSDTFRLHVGVAYGPNDLLSVNGSTNPCEGAVGGGEFCAVANQSVTVVKRL